VILIKHPPVASRVKSGTARAVMRFISKEPVIAVIVAIIPCKTADKEKHRTANRAVFLV